MLKFDRILITQVASKIEAVRPDKTATFEPIWIQRLNAPVFDALHRLISLLDDPMLIPQLAPLIQQEIIVRLPTGPHASDLWHLVNAAGPTQQIAQAVTWIRQHFTGRDASGRSGRMRQHESDHVPVAFSDYHRNEPVQFQKLLRLQEARQLMLDQT